MMYLDTEAPIQIRFFQGMNERMDKARLMNVLDMHTIYQTQTTSV